ncbi:MAG: hypothetical protein JWR32_513 [Mycobacterium sp.]|jgi:uncharacterized membrane protein YoaK (UPF0700 family)|nr:hypothetical protein [Mycobacterium sp.]
MGVSIDDINLAVQRFCLHGTRKPGRTRRLRPSAESTAKQQLWHSVVTKTMRNSRKIAPSASASEPIRAAAGRPDVPLRGEYRARMGRLRFTTSGQNVRDLFLVALTIASGAVDAISYFGLGKTFSAFMTGNIVFLGFGIAKLKGPALLPVICALSAFAVGAYIGLRIATRRSDEPGSWPGRMSALLILVAISEAGFLAVWSATSGHPTHRIGDVLIALFSLAMGIQTAAVRSLGVQGVFTTAGTFTLVAFAGTLAGSREKAEIPRLVGVLLGLVAGAVGGGLLFLYARSYAPVLPLAVTILVLAAGRTVQRST